MDDEWYYCVEHDTVEPKVGCRVTNRLGPYPSREEAARAMETVERRNEEWDENDRWEEVE